MVVVLVCIDEIKNIYIFHSRLYLASESTTEVPTSESSISTIIGIYMLDLKN